MSLKTKTGGAAAIVALVAAGWVVVGTWGDPSKDASHRRGVVPASIPRGAQVRLFVSWQRPYTPNHVITYANDGRQDYTSTMLPALLGHVTWVYRYDPQVTYSIAVNQNNPNSKATLCQIVVDNQQVDRDARDGVGTLNCVAQG